MSKLEVRSVTNLDGETDLELGKSGGTVTLADGATAVGFGSGGSLESVQYFTSMGTWTKPSGVTKVMVEVQGAGGGGATNASSAPGNSGGAGGNAIKLIDVTSISSATITVGSGGAAGNPAVAGGDSIWDDGTNVLTGGGGNGGYRSASRPTVDGGSASGGDLNMPGPNGSWSFSGGGCSRFGSGGAWGNSGSTGFAAYGSGGNGSNATNGNFGGQGGDGIVIVTEYK